MAMLNEFEKLEKYVSGGYKGREVSLVLGRTIVQGFPGVPDVSPFEKTSDDEDPVRINVSAIQSVSLVDSLEKLKASLERVPNDEQLPTTGESDGKDVFSAMPEGTPGSFGRTERDGLPVRRRIGRRFRKPSE